jgi:hypothetical protein
VRSYDEQINAAMDFVLRVDLTGPLDEADLKLTEESAAERAARESKNEEEIRKRIEEQKSIIEEEIGKRIEEQKNQETP